MDHLGRVSGVGAVRPAGVPDGEVVEGHPVELTSGVVDPAGLARAGAAHEHEHRELARLHVAVRVRVEVGVVHRVVGQLERIATCVAAPADIFGILGRHDDDAVVDDTRFTNQASSYAE